MGKPTVFSQQISTNSGHHLPGTEFVDKKGTKKPQFETYFFLLSQPKQPDFNFFSHKQSTIRNKKDFSISLPIFPTILSFGTPKHIRSKHFHEKPKSLLCKLILLSLIGSTKSILF